MGQTGKRWAATATRKRQHRQLNGQPNAKSPGQNGTGAFCIGAGLQEPGEGRQHCLPCKLLCRLCRRGGTGSSGSSSIGSSLVGIAAGGSSAVGSVASRICSVGGSSTGSGSIGWCWSGLNHNGRRFHWRRHNHNCGLFLFAASGQGSNSKQRSQNERFVHFRIPYRQTDRKNGGHGVQPLAAGIRSGSVRVSAHLHQPTIILSPSQF